MKSDRVEQWVVFNTLLGAYLLMIILQGWHRWEMEELVYWLFVAAGPISLVSAMTCKWRIWRWAGFVGNCWMLSVPILVGVAGPFISFLLVLTAMCNLGLLLNRGESQLQRGRV